MHPYQQLQQPGWATGHGHGCPRAGPSPPAPPLSHGSLCVVSWVWKIGHVPVSQADKSWDPVSVKATPPSCFLVPIACLPLTFQLMLLPLSSQDLKSKIT